LSEFGETLDEQARHYLDRVRTASRKMAVLIDDLLELSRINRGPLREIPVDLTSLAEGVIDELRRSDHSRAISVEIAEGLTAKGDARLLTVALEHLAGNAWKFTAKRADARIEVGATEDGPEPAFPSRAGS